jgi:hypothetical protein
MHLADAIFFPRVDLDRLSHIVNGLARHPDLAGYRRLTQIITE